LGTLAASNIQIGSYRAGAKIFKDLFSAIVASGLFALFYVLVKLEYTRYDFITPFFWTRVGMILGAVFILVFMNKDGILWNSFKSSTNKLKFGFVGTKMLSGLAFLLVAIAAYLGDVSLVNAMQGLQYAFLIVISFAIIRIKPIFIKENYQSKELIPKITSIILVFGGLLLLGLGGQ